MIDVGQLVGQVFNAIQLPMLIGALAYFVRSEIRKSSDALKLDNAMLRMELSTQVEKRSSELEAEQKVSGQVHINVDRRISALERLYNEIPRLMQSILGELKRIGARSIGGGSGGPPEGSESGGGATAPGEVDV